MPLVLGVKVLWLSFETDSVAKTKVLCHLFITIFLNSEICPYECYVELLMKFHHKEVNSNYFSEIKSGVSRDSGLNA
jgi:hypothetical protein